MNKNNFAHDLTGGSVVKNLIKFSLPFLLSNFIQAMYSVSDMIIVSWFSGPASVSGVSNGGQVTVIVINFIVGLTMGGTVLIGQYYGAKRYGDIKKTTGTMFSVLIIMAVILTVVMIILCDPILRLIQVPPDAFSEARRFYTICMSGTVFIFGYNAVSAVLRGMGDSKRPLYFVSVACGLNIVLDLITVGVFKLGAAGAALSTVTAQAFSLVISVIYLVKNDFMFDFKPSSFRIDFQKVKLILAIGIPSSLQNTIVGISFLVMMALVNGYGTAASAAVGIVGKFNGFAILPGIAMSAAISSMSAQNIGAGLPDRARQTMITGFKIVYPICMLFFLLAFIFPKSVMYIFTTDPDVITQGVKYIKSFCFDYLVVPITFCMNGLFTGAGKTMFIMVNGISTSVLFRIPVALLFGKLLNFGLTGIGIAAPAASFCALISCSVYLILGHWKKSVIKHDEKI